MSSRQTIRVMLWFREGVGVLKGFEFEVEGLVALRVQVAGAGEEGQFFFTVRAKHGSFLRFKWWGSPFYHGYKESPRASCTRGLLL